MKAFHRSCGWKSKVHFILISFLGDSCSSLEHILLKLCQIIFRSKSVTISSQIQMNDINLQLAANPFFGIVEFMNFSFLKM